MNSSRKPLEAVGLAFIVLAWALMLITAVQIIKQLIEG